MLPFRRFRWMIIGVVLTLAALLAFGFITPLAVTQAINPSDGNKVLNIAVAKEYEEAYNKAAPQWCAAKGLECNATFIDSVDQAQLLQGDPKDPKQAPYDVYLLADETFQNKNEAFGDTLQDVEPVLSTPIVYAGQKAEMDRLGFATGRSVPFDKIERAITNNQTDVWLPNPTQSSTGAAVMFAQMNHAAGNDGNDAVSKKQQQSPEVKKATATFVQSVDRTPPSTEALLKDCAQTPDNCKTFFAEEASIIQHNNTAGNQPFYVVYPQGGLSVTNVNIAFLPHGNEQVDDQKHEDFEALRNQFWSEQAQKDLANLGWRPVSIDFWDHPMLVIGSWWRSTYNFNITDIQVPAETFKEEWGIQPELQEEVVDTPDAQAAETALDEYQTEYRKPVDTYYCLDGSGSMGPNNGWVNLQKATTMLFDPAESAKYSLQVHPQDRTTVDIFNHAKLIEPMQVDGNNPDKLKAVDNRIQNLGPDGNTAIYDCLVRAGVHFNATPTNNDETSEDVESRGKLIILMTDGHNTAGIGKDNPAAIDPLLGQLKQHNIPVNTMGFGGEADRNALQDISAKTAGSYNESNNLQQGLRELTSYK